MKTGGPGIGGGRRGRTLAIGRDYTEDFALKNGTNDDVFNKNDNTAPGAPCRLTKNVTH
jgi:hypothetical protein